MHRLMRTNSTGIAMVALLVSFVIYVTLTVG